MSDSATKIAGGAQVREGTRGDWLFRSGKQRLDGFLRHEIDLLIGRPRFHSHADQLLVSLRRPFEDRVFESVQREAEGGGSVGFCGLHPIVRNSNARAKFLRQREKERRRSANG